MMTWIEADDDDDSCSDSIESDQEIETGAVPDIEPRPRKRFFVGVDKHLHIFIVSFEDMESLRVIEAHYDLNLPPPTISFQNTDMLEIKLGSFDSEIWTGYLTNKIKNGCHRLKRHWLTS